MPIVPDLPFNVWPVLASVLFLEFLVSLSSRSPWLHPLSRCPFDEDENYKPLFPLFIFAEINSERLVTCSNLTSASLLFLSRHIRFRYLAIHRHAMG